MMILKGQNVFPADIEEILETHPDIAEAKVMGKADIVRSETIKAMVKLKPGKTVTEQEIRQYCQGRMADYKLPKEISIVDSLPAVTPLWRRQQNLELADIRLE